MTPVHCQDDIKIVEGFQDVIHAIAHLKAMFLPSPLLCSVFLRLTDKSGMRA